jgi:pimeloyl-ACP methyl ester carboxylesterase
MTLHINQGAVESVPGTDITFRRTGQGRQSVLFVHGYLDSHAIWDDVIASLNTPDAEFVTLDLAGMGDRADAEGPFTLDRYADEVGKVADLLAGPTVIVGHSIGAPITELVAAKRPDTVALVLIASVQRPRQRPITRQPHTGTSASTERAQHKDASDPGQRPAHPVRRF